jgi:uncharacterized protein YceK
MLLLNSCSSYSTQLSTSQEMAKSVCLKEPIPLIYGGVRMDAEMLNQIVTIDFEPDPAGAAQAQVFGTIYVILDFPFSLSLDTILLPWSIYKNSNKVDVNSSNKSKENISDK